MSDIFTDKCDVSNRGFVGKDIFRTIFALNTLTGALYVELSLLLDSYDVKIVIKQ